MQSSPLKHDLPERQLRQAAAELERQLTAGQPARAEAWLERLPALAAEEELALELIYGEFIAREALGQRPEPTEYYSRFPTLEDRLRRLFEVDALLQKEKDPHQTSVDPGLTGDGSSNIRFHSLRVAGHSANVVHVPATFGDFLPMDRLGSGGMGVVYRAQQQSLGRLVALKVIREEIAADPDIRARFLREARIVAKLEHPHIVRIHEAGEHEGRLFLALEYIAGGSLRAKLQGKPLRPDDAAALVEMLARAMHFAHEQGIRPHSR